MNVTYHYEGGKIFRTSPEYNPHIKVWFYYPGTGRPEVREIDPAGVPFEEFNMWHSRSAQGDLSSTVTSIEDALKGVETQTS